MIGGIHASGKSKICSEIKKDFPDTEIISPSKLLNHSSKEKNVVNIPQNQILLSNVLKNLISSHSLAVIDGHYGVLDLNQSLKFVGFDIFKEINPDLLLLVESSPETILHRLKIRDNKIYNLDKIKEWSKDERKYALQASCYLNRTLYIINGEN